MNQPKFLKFLSVIGAFFILFLILSYARTVQTSGDVFDNKVAVPKSFSRQFGYVQTRNRAEKMPHATFMSPEGRRVNWQVFEGKYLLVNFWATWCGPCVVELPSLDKLQQKFKSKNLEVIAVSLDTQRPQEQIKAFLRNRNIGEFASYFDDAREVKSAIPMRGIPTTYLLDPQGNIRYVFEGDAVWHSPSAVQFFENVLVQDSL